MMNRAGVRNRRYVGGIRIHNKKVIRMIKTLSETYLKFFKLNLTNSQIFKFLFAIF